MDVTAEVRERRRSPVAIRRLDALQVGDVTVRRQVRLTDCLTCALCSGVNTRLSVSLSHSPRLISCDSDYLQRAL